MSLFGTRVHKASRHGIRESTICTGFSNDLQCLKGGEAVLPLEVLHIIGTPSIETLRFLWPIAVHVDSLCETGVYSLNLTGDFAMFKGDDRPIAIWRDWF